MREVGGARVTAEVSMAVVIATVEAYDVEGNKFSYGGTGLIAHLFQHETDHLDGVLFIDHGFDFEEFTEQEIKAGEKKMKEDAEKEKELKLKEK